MLQKSFCTDDQKFSGPLTRFSCKDVGTSSPDDKLASDLANAIEAVQIGDRRLDRVEAGKLPPANFGLLQQYLPKAEIRHSHLANDRHAGTQ
jgi:hypothetical protein